MPKDVQRLSKHIFSSIKIFVHISIIRLIKRNRCSMDRGKIMVISILKLKLETPQLPSKFLTVENVFGSPDITSDGTDSKPFK